MIVIISPAKQMYWDPDSLSPAGAPLFLDRSRELLARLREFSLPQLRVLLGCSEKLASQAFAMFRDMDLDRQPAAPALLSYRGIQYQYMLPGAFTDSQLAYLQEHLRILSGFYGLLRPLDGILPYRLEMQARLDVGAFRDLYAFWGDTLSAALEKEAEGVILNLASEEYARAVRPHLSPGIRWVTPVFGQLENGRLREKGVYVKMARGEMVRFLAEKSVREPEEIRNFSRLGFRFDPALSSPDIPVFLKE